MALAVPSDQVNALQVAVQDQILGNNHEDAMKAAKEALALAQKEGSKMSEATALLSLGQAYRATGKAKDAVQKASEARELFKKTSGATGEGVALALIAAIHHEQTDELSYDLSAQKTAYNSAVRAGRDAVKCLTEGGGAPLVLADAQNILCNLMLSKGDFKMAIGSAVEAVEIFKEHGDENGRAEALLNLCESHIIAGNYEDYHRQQMFLPQANMHAAAAGKYALEASKIFQKLGKADKMRRCSVILDMERIQQASSYRNKQFDYSTWKNQATVK